MLRPRIPLEDLPLLQELAKTLSVAEMADKWDVGTQAITNFLKRHGKPANRIKLEYRIQFIKDHPDWTAYDFAAEFNIATSSVWRIKSEH